MYKFSMIFPDLEITSLKFLDISTFLNHNTNINVEINEVFKVIFVKWSIFKV